MGPFTLLLIRYKYLLILPISIVEGPIISMIAGFLIKLGYLSLIPAYLLLMTGDLFGDIGWYCIGYFFGEGFIKRFGAFFSLSEKNIEIVKKIFHNHQSSILLISKITMGFGFALVTLITAGVVKIPFKRYVFFNICGQVVWTGLLLSVGFFFGNLYVQINNDLGRLTVLTLFVTVLASLIGFAAYVRRQAIKEYSP